MKKREFNKILNKMILLIESQSNSDFAIKEELTFIKEQIKKAKIKNSDHKCNNKYVYFCNKRLAGCRPISISHISIIVEDINQNIPFGFVLHCRDGFMYALEVYSCDLQSFSKVLLKNIDFKYLSGSFRTSHESYR